MRKKTNIQSTASRISVPIIWLREKRISQEQVCQFGISRSHEHFTLDFENGNQLLSRQLIHGAQGAEVLRNVTFDMNNSVLGQPTPRMFAQRTSGNHIKRYQLWTLVHR